MKIGINHPERICWLAIPAILLTGLIASSRKMDFQLHDTYFVVNGFDLAIFFSFILGIVSLGYWLVNLTGGKTLRLLSWIHLTVTFGSISSFLLLAFSIPSYADIGNKYEIYKVVNHGMMVSFFTLIFCQPIYLINLVFGFSKRKKGILQ